MAVSRPAGPHFIPHRGDALLASFPRSGNTWVRFILAAAIAGDCRREVDFHTLENFVPDVYVSSERFIRGRPRPRVIKTHQAANPLFGRSIYLVREPGAVAASYRRFLLTYSRTPDLVDPGRFTEQFCSTAPHIREFGTWRTNVESWLQAPETLVIRYEDIETDPVTSTKRMVEHIGLSVPEQGIQGYLDVASAERMAALDQEQGDSSATLGYRGGGQSIKPPPLEGVAPLNVEHLAHIRRSHADLVKRLGFETSDDGSDRRLQPDC